MRKLLCLLVFLPLLSYSQYTDEEISKKFDSINSLHTSNNKQSFNTDCLYLENGLDPIDGFKKVRTEFYSLYSGKPDFDRLSISIIKIGSQRFVNISSTEDLGCVSSYSSNKSKVVLLLENGKKVTFYHTGNLNCSDFDLTGRLSQQEVSTLKQSPLKLVRLHGTKYYQDIDNFLWKEFFIDMLNCIE